MKRIIYVAITTLLCICLVGCTSADLNGTTSASVNVSQVIDETANSTDKAAEVSKSKNSTVKNGASNTGNSHDNGKVTEKTTHNTGTTKKQVTTEKHTTSKKQETTKHISSSKATTKGAKQTTTSTTASSTLSCTVYIECSTILDNMDDLKPGHEDFVPQNGVIMSRTTVTVKNGSTAYDALCIACKQQGVTMNVSSSGYGKYIVGFNNIDEKDCGSQSGWTYKVNKKSIWKSCDKYTICDGDSIDFSYICKY